jgi:hypothetical protein
MTQEQFNDATLNLLISIKSEIMTLRDFTLTYMLKENMDKRKQAADFYNKTNEDYREQTRVNIISHYSGFDVDDFLNNIL